jgi:hypothetical protein
MLEEGEINKKVKMEKKNPEDYDIENGFLGIEKMKIFSILKRFHNYNTARLV